MTRPFLFLQDRIGTRPCDKILWESEDFVVVPTLGALIQGWILVIPKTPFICVGALTEPLREQLSNIKNYCAEIIEEQFGEAAIFEHGPAVAGDAVGCTVDYAHLHILPARCHLIDSIPNISAKSPLWQSANDISATKEYFQSGISYLYVEQPVGKSMIANARDMPSQLFRRVVAHSVGLPEQFNWREHPMQENVLATVAILEHSFQQSLFPACVC